MELQLAESPLKYTPYIWIPNIQSGGGVYCREDKFDSLSEAEFDDLLEQIAPYQMDDLGLSEPDTLQMLASFKSRRAERRAHKKDKKDSKIEKKRAKTDIKKARAEKKRAAGEAKKTKAEAKREQAEAGDGENENQKTATTWMEKITDTVGKFGKGGGDAEAADTSGSDSDTSKKNKTMYWVIGGAAALLVVGGVAIAVTRKGKAA